MACLQAPMYNSCAQKAPLSSSHNAHSLSLLNAISFTLPHLHDFPHPSKPTRSPLHFPQPQSPPPSSVSSGTSPVIRSDQTPPLSSRPPRCPAHALCVSQWSHTPAPVSRRRSWAVKRTEIAGPQEVRAAVLWSGMRRSYPGEQKWGRRDGHVEGHRLFLHTETDFSVGLGSSRGTRERYLAVSVCR